MMNWMTLLGTPVQIRVFDSRSYFFMTASTSAAVPTEVSCTSVCAGGRRAVNFYLLCRSLCVLFLEQGHMKTILSSRYFAEPGSAELSKVSGCFLAQ